MLNGACTDRMPTIRPRTTRERVMMMKIIINAYGWIWNAFSSKSQDLKHLSSAWLLSLVILDPPLRNDACHKISLSILLLVLSASLLSLSRFNIETRYRPKQTKPCQSNRGFDVEIFAMLDDDEDEGGGNQLDL